MSATGSAAAAAAAGTGRATVLVIDDDPGVLALCTAALEREFRVVAAADGIRGLRAVYERRPDVVLLDVTMPGMNGFAVCQRLREVTDIPVVMLTARGADEDVARGLDAGADDYVVKPFRPVQLAARLRAALRRHQRGAGEPDRMIFQDGELVVDTGRRVAVVRGVEVSLSAIEYRLLEVLARHAGQVLTHDQLVDYVWGFQYAGETTYVKTYVNLLRKKIERDPSRPALVLSRRGLGYYLEPRTAAPSNT